MRIALVLFASLSLFLPFNLTAEEASMYFQRESVGVKTYPAAPRLVQRAGIAPAASLRAATESIPEELEAIALWNREGKVPGKNGIVRSLGETMEVHLGALAGKSGLHGRGVAATTEHGTAWGTSVRVENAKRLRLHLERVLVPAGTVFWVYGSSGEAIGFDESLADPQNRIWTPSVDGDTIHLEVEVPAGASVPASFAISEVLELLHARNLRPERNDEPTCLNGQDVNCQSASEFAAIDAARAAVGQMEYVKDGTGRVCSGTLIADQQQSGTAYFLTANHCISTQASASSLQTYFDFRFLSCVSASATSLPRITGSTLLATSEATDVTLLRLSSVPAGRWFMGWNSNASAVPNGTALHRVSHPFPDAFDQALPQMYSRTLVRTSGGTCTGVPRSRYLYSNETSGGEGGVYGGSSGSAAILANGQIVGQLLGSCGPDGGAGCDRRNDTVDGAFSVSMDVLRPFLASTGAGPQPCAPNTSTICLVNNRFSVRVTYDVGSGPQPMTAIKYTAESGLFWFASATNIEVLLKMINACSFNNRYWVYSGGTTDVGVTITVTDSQTGTVKTYNNPRGTKFGTITDSGAFATCP